MHPPDEITSPTTSDAVLRLEALRVRYRTPGGVVTAVAGVDLALGAGEILALVGASGSGKSSLALAVMGLLPPSAEVDGRILLAGRDLSRACPADRRPLAMVFQEPGAALHPLRRVRALVAEPIRVHRRLSRAAEAAEVVRLLRLAGLEDAAALLDAWPHQLSGGQQQRVLLAQALALEPRVLIADEPTASLDSVARQRVLATLAELRARLGLAVLLISHDLRTVARVARRVAVLEGGALVAVGPPERVLATATEPGP